MDQVKPKHKGWPVGKKRDKPSHVGQRKDLREAVLRKIGRHKDAILQAQIEDAKGLFYYNAEKDIVFTKKPNTAIGEYLLNQLIGKPKESIDHSGEVSLKIDI